MSVNKLIQYIEQHPCYSHPIFENWAKVNPSRDVVAALFHQIRSFCDSTRPVHNLPASLEKNGFKLEKGLIDSIGESEENHGPQLATMAGYVINKVDNEIIFSDLYDTNTIEKYMKQKSDQFLSTIPGYDIESGLLIQNRMARAAFDDRKKMDCETLFKNLGTTIALEMISHRQLIPGEKHCLVDSGNYAVDMDDEQMHYLKEHWGETGAEANHEQAALDAIESVMTPETEAFFLQGARELLDPLAALWDTLDCALLGSGYLQAAHHQQACCA